MGFRVAGAMLLAALLAGCADGQQFSGLQGPQGASAFAMATPEPARAKTADPSFRLNELRVGLSKAELETLYPNRLVLSSRDGGNHYYFVEPPGVAAGSKVVRDRLGLFLSDGKLAAFGMMSSNDPVIGATEIAMVLPSLPTRQPMSQRKATPPAGKFGVQIAARNSEAEGRALIDQMRAKFPSLLGQQWAALHRVSLPQGVVYRVVIGPLDSAQQAAQLCAKLKAQGTECFTRGT